MDSKRANMIEYGIMNENTRKLLSKDDTADQTAKTDGDYDQVIAKSLRTTFRGTSELLLQGRSRCCRFSHRRPDDFAES
ncbi:Hypothetical predicted protein, partial [Paramuricea clavata]